MDVSWDAENFEPKLPTTLTSAHRWEGEDEEETVKDSWEDEEEEKKDEEKKEATPAPPPAKPKKKIQEKIAEKERLEREKSEQLADKEEELTPEQKLAEKLRRQKLQEESDLRLALETFGITEVGGSGKLDSFNPTTKEEFTEFADLLTKKITFYKSREEFPAFIDDLVKNIVLQMPSADIKRIKLTVDNLYIEKQKAEKNDKGKKPTKGKGKAKLKVEGDNAHLNQYDAYGNYDDDFDDFI
ncbi:eukaryotic translation initiation factor 3 subunit J [Maniola jurtina]|uniref:eukaryotic translation initiation factor 3 subunit J n=1 Tax=Maniola jurtina TaxID=191418 RepID=UPI001E68F35A|nr:eukaryotic translation initiation factor 3 subunit J [Maniola jurtina]